MKQKDGKRKGMSEMRVGEKKKRGKGISRKAKEKKRKKNHKVNLENTVCHIFQRILFVSASQSIKHHVHEVIQTKVQRAFSNQ